MENYVLEKFAVKLPDVVEPITVAQAKFYAKITDSFDDIEIAQMITAARQAIEAATQLCLVPSTVTAYIDNSRGCVELPLGPYVSDFTLNAKDGSAITNYTLILEHFKQLESPTESYLKATYKAGYSAKGDAGYPVMPEDLLNAIKDQFAFLYGNRGDNVSDMTVCAKAWRTCIRYTRKPLFN